MVRNEAIRRMLARGGGPLRGTGVLSFSVRACEKYRGRQIDDLIRALYTLGKYDAVLKSSGHVSSIWVVKVEQFFRVVSNYDM